MTFNTHIPTILLIVSIAISCTSAYITIADVPSTSPGFAFVPSTAPSSSKHVNVPMDEQASDVHYLKTMMAKATINIESFKSSVLENRLKDPAVDQATKECLNVCSEVYDSAVDALNKGLEDVSERDFMSVNIDVSAFMTNIDTCTDCLGDSEDASFKKFDKWAKGIGSDWLERIVKYNPSPY